MSVICQTFVQNAWRSDLCSNCFKCLAEHSDSRNPKDRMSTPRYMPQATSLYQSRGISSTLKWRLSEPIYERVARRDFGSQTPSKTSEEPPNNNRGILIKYTTPEKKLRSRPSVDFASEEALVIGYGGNDYDSDQSPWEMASDDESIDLDLLNDTDEDRKISRLTKNNTEFNSSNKNLQDANREKEDKLNCINNNANNANKNGPIPLKALACVTYNDIQPQKKINQYYFSSNIEPLKSHLHNANDQSSKPSNNNNNNDPVVVKVDNVQKAVDNNCRNMLSDDFTPLNTRTYSFVSELNKNITGSEHSSDSDYSTCRLTAGDSTDSESFQDAEEPRIIPCSSFLHGSFPRKLQQQSSMNSLDSDKKYDAGSSTSGDVSNLSDDSDTIESSERTFKSRTSRSSKGVPSSADKRGGQQRAPLEKKSPPSSPNHNQVGADDVSVKMSDAIITSSATISPNAKNASATSPPKKQDSDKNEAKQPFKRDGGAVYVSIDAHPNSRLKPDCMNHAERQQQPPPPNPNPPVEINLRNIITVNKSNLKESSKTNTSATPTEAKSSPPRTLKLEDSSQKTHRKPAPVKEQKIHRTSSTTDESKPDTPPEKAPSDDDEGSPEAINNRQSKLAALALELELARRDSEIKSGKAPPPPSLPPPEVKAKCSPRTTNSTSNYPTIKKGSGVSCTSRLAALPDVLNESPNTTKLKKNRFSLKKLLKRNKDSGTFTPAEKEINPKAWKKQTFDRNRLSLEIVHPMDMSPPTSGDSTPTEEGHYAVSSHPGRGGLRGGYSRARSLSALPQLSGEYHEPTLLDCRKVDTMPTRKAGTVAERKKNRPSLVRTPSCSALPNRPTVTTQDRTPPPKPPPPPKCMQPPPPPPHQPRKHPACSPARPPPPKIPETKSRIQSGDSSKADQRDSCHLDKEYANLGDIRSLMTPKKPQRPSAVSGARDSSDGSKRHPDEFYEKLQVPEEEEDHYTYLDDTEVKSHKNQGVVVKASPTSPETNSSARGRPWLDLQTSYAAIAAANYESLAEIITTSANEGAELFENGGKSLRWKDFSLDAEEPQMMTGNRRIYNTTYKGNKFLLMVTPKQQSSPKNPRNQVRYPVLASFSDSTPPSGEWASIYVLQPSTVFSLGQFAQSTSSDKTDQHVHLRNYCFILLQLIHTLKILQAEGIEDIHLDLQQLLLVATHQDKPPIFILFAEDKTHLTLSDSGHNRKTLCQATLTTMYHFLRIEEAEDLGSCSVNGELLSEPVAHTFKVIAKVLLEEKASSLSQAKGFLEYMLWGPVDVRISDTTEVLDTVLQRWLDLQRAQMVKSTISQIQQKTHLHVYEEYQLVFLLQASVKSLKSVISKL